MTQNHPLGFKHLRSGSSKELYRVDAHSLGFGFTNYFSVFDVGRSTYEIPEKGKAVCDCAVKAFEIAEAVGVPTHFMERIDDTTIRVREVQTITDRPMTPVDRNYLLPAEWISRYMVAGSLERAFISGEEQPENYGLPAGIPVTGTPLPYPIHQLTTKFEQFDRKMTLDELCNNGGITRLYVEECWRMIDRLDGALALQAHKAGFLILDGKKELYLGPNGEKGIGDVFLTPDEDRPAKIVGGEVVHYSKEFLRQLFIAMGYKKLLDEARKAGKSDIPIPKLPESQIAEAHRRYVDFAKAF